MIGVMSPLKKTKRLECAPSLLKEYIILVVGSSILVGILEIRQWIFIPNDVNGLMQKIVTQHTDKLDGNELGYHHACKDRVAIPV
jgi:hypothetical protein